MFSTISAVTVSMERFYSALKKIENILRTAVCQDRLSKLGELTAVETETCQKYRLGWCNQS